jgi:hypothetical protein
MHPMKYKDLKRKGISNWFMQVMTKKDDEEEYTFEPILEKIDYSLGGYSYRERWSRPMKMESIDFDWRRKIIDYVLEQIIDFIVKKINMQC